MMGSFSKWLNVEIVRHCDTKSTILGLSKCFTQFGIPVRFISDNGIK